MPGKKKDIGETSDGYHTFNELYEHRHALFCYAIRHGIFNSPEAILNHYKGWDLLIVETKNYEQISYHLPVKYRRLWRDYGIVDEVTENPWDGHTSKQVVRRLNKP